MLKQGVKVWNKWQQENPDTTPDLVGADLSMANLVRASLHETVFGHTRGPVTKAA